LSDESFVSLATTSRAARLRVEVETARTKQIDIHGTISTRYIDKRVEMTRVAQKTAPVFIHYF